MTPTSQTPRLSACSLPDRPSLEYLRRDAKRHLQTLRLAAPATRLADAQLGLARAYGFPSWRALKREVEARLVALGVAPPDPRYAALPRPWVSQHPALQPRSAGADQLFFQATAMAMGLMQIAEAARLLRFGLG